MVKSSTMSSLEQLVTHGGVIEETITGGVRGYVNKTSQEHPSLRDQLVAGIRELLPRRREGGPTIFKFPTSPHINPYYGSTEIYSALIEAIGYKPDNQAQRNLELAFTDVIDKVTSHDVYEHAQTSGPIAVTLPGGKEVEFVPLNATVIARRGQLDLLYPIDKDARERARRTCLITTLDQYLAGYYALDAFTGFNIHGNHIPKQAPLTLVTEAMKSLQERSMFTADAVSNRRELVTILPLPPENGWVNPKFSLIGPKEVDFQKALRQSSETKQHVTIQAKKNQFELVAEWAKTLGAVRLVVISQDGRKDFRIYGEHYQTHYTSRDPDPIRGLDVWVIAQDGDVDGIVRSTQNGINSKKIRDVSGCFGLDVVQTGRGMAHNGLVEIEKVLPVPCYLVAMSALRN